MLKAKSYMDITKKYFIHRFVGVIFGAVVQQNRRVSHEP